MVLTHTYDAVGNRLSTGDNLGVQVLSAYDARNLLSSRAWQGTGIDPARAEFDYNALGQTTELRRFADATGTNQIGRSTFDYDVKGRLTDLTHRDALDSVLADYDYVRDLADQLTAETHHGETHDYTHDSLGQLTAADHATATDEAYTYDANGNRTTAGHVVGPANRLLSDGTFNYDYDAEGNLVRKTEIATGNTTEYTYDHRNRLVQAQEKSTGGIILAESTYTYDLFDRRIAKTVDPDGPGPQAAETTRFVYNGLHVWADFDATGTILARYLFGDRIDQLLARHRPGEGTAWHLTDHLGTVRDIVDAAGTVINHLDYDSFGNVLLETNPLSGDRYRFTGREFDPELGLYYYRARYYDPSIGRFTTEDPIAFAGGDHNLYRYVGNSPLTFVDPFGMFTITYATMGRAALRAGNAVVGFAIGYACGYLEGWYRGDPDPHEQALNSAILGTAIGAALGATPAKFQLFVGIAGAVTAIGTSDDWVIAGIRTTCIAVQVGVAKGLRKLEQRWFPEGRWVPSGRSGGSYWEGPGVPPKPLAPRPFAPRTGVARVGTPSPTTLKKSGIQFSAAVDEVPISDLTKLHPVPRPGKPATHIRAIAESMQESGFDLDNAIQVFRMPDGSLRVAGGHHRIAAMEIAGESNIPAQILDWSKASQAGRYWFAEMFPHLQWP